MLLVHDCDDAFYAQCASFHFLKIKHSDDEENIGANWNYGNNKIIITLCQFRENSQT